MLQGPHYNSGLRIRIFKINDWFLSCVHFVLFSGGFEVLQVQKQLVILASLVVLSTQPY